MLIDSNPTIGAISSALDAAVLRQQVIAFNIANAGTPGFRPLTVSFEDRLDGARQKLRSGESLSEESLRKTVPRIVQESGTLNEGVRLDLQSTELARNSVHYHGLIRVLNKQLAILQLAVSEGRK